VTEKKFKLGGMPRFKQLQPGEDCEFSGASIPEEFESEWDTGYGENKNSKWSLTLTLLKHPHPSYSFLTGPGKDIEVVWETVAEVIRISVVESLKDKDFAKAWKDPEFIWTLTRRDDGSYMLEG
jgi:hypothetical protein